MPICLARAATVTAFSCIWSPPAPLPASAPVTMAWSGPTCPWSQVPSTYVCTGDGDGSFPRERGRGGSFKPTVQRYVDNVQNQKE